MSIVLGLSGRIGSGKSTLAKEIGARIDAPVASFGDLCRSVSRRMWGFEDRHYLQELGKLAVQLAPDAFCARVLEEANFEPGAQLVIEGIRHVTVLERLEKLVSPSKFVLVHVDTPEEIIRGRLKEEEGGSDEDLKELERDSTEADVINELPQRAALRVGGGNGMTPAELSLVVIERLGLPLVRQRAMDRETFADADLDWTRYHRLLDLRASRNLTEGEEGEWKIFRRAVSERHRAETNEIRGSVQEGRSAHQRTLESIDALASALESWRRKHTVHEE